MHVLIIHQAFASASEAGGTRHYEFARHLVSQGHRVSVVAGQVSYLTGAVVAEHDPEPIAGMSVEVALDAQEFRSSRH